MEPEDLAGYSLRRRLGSGSAGALWQVRDLATGRHAVLRRIPVTAIQREEQFRDELIVLGRINHPHITPILEVRETATEWFVFSQYVVALSLTEVLRRRGTMSPGEIVTLLSPLADALHYLHHCGLIHGHVTPPNILIDVEGRPILTDATFHSLNLHPLTSPHPEPPSHAADLLALPTIAVQAGGPATLFAPAVFSKTPAPRLASHLLTLTTPEPINLGDPDDPPPNPHPTTPPTAGEDAVERSRTSRDPHSTMPPTADDDSVERSRTSHDLHSTMPPAGDDDPIEQSRTPLVPPPPKLPVPTTRQPIALGVPAFKPMLSRPKPRRRALMPKLTRRTANPAPNPLSRLTSTPLTRTHVVHPTETHLIGTTHVEPAISWSAPPVPVGERRAPDAFAAPRQPLRSTTADGNQPPALAGPAPRRGRTRRRVWRRRHTWWGRLDLSRPLTELRYRLGHPAYGVTAAVGLGIVVVLGLGLATRAVLGKSGTATSAETLSTATAPTSRPANPVGSPNQTDSATPTTPPPTTPVPSAPASTAPTTQASSTPAPTTPGMTNPATAPPRRLAPRRSVADWLATLRALDAQRAQAFRTLNTAMLDKIYVLGSLPWASDRALLADYRKHQIHIQGLRIQIDKTTIAHQSPTTVTLRTTDHLASGQAVHKSGTRTPLPPGAPTTRLITLTRTSSQITTTPTWRITTITPP